jgi:DNA-binding HxlR family transcriptional regulator
MQREEGQQQQQQYSLPDRNDPAYWCAVTETCNVFAKKWHPVIVQRLLRADPKTGRRFSEILKSIRGMSSKVLSQNLEELERNGLVERQVFSTKPVVVAYNLTPKGRGLKPVVDAMVEYAKTWLMKDNDRNPTTNSSVVFDSSSTPVAN